jgi:hypothetical protein
MKPLLKYYLAYQIKNNEVGVACMGGAGKVHTEINGETSKKGPTSNTKAIDERILVKQILKEIG